MTQESKSRPTRSRQSIDYFGSPLGVPGRKQVTLVHFLLDGGMPKSAVGLTSPK